MSLEFMKKIKEDFRMKNTHNAELDWSNFNSSVIIEVTRPEGLFTSSGVAINSTTILTAAHCLDGEVLKVRIFIDSQYNKNGTFWDVRSFELHPDYNVEKSNFKADLAKIKLTNPLPESINYFPISKSEMDFSGNLVRLGFGARSDKNIRTLVTPVLKRIRSLDKVLELNDMYSYSGDSGGPVFLQKGSQLTLVAIHSTLSHGPEGKYSFNPLLSAHRDWIAA